MEAGWQDGIESRDGGLYQVAMVENLVPFRSASAWR